LRPAAERPREPSERWTRVADWDIAAVHPKEWTYLSDGISRAVPRAEVADLREKFDFSANSDLLGPVLREITYFSDASDDSDVSDLAHALKGKIVMGIGEVDGSPVMQVVRVGDRRSAVDLEGRGIPWRGLLAKAFKAHVRPLEGGLALRDLAEKIESGQQPDVDLYGSMIRRVVFTLPPGYDVDGYAEAGLAPYRGEETSAGWTSIGVILHPGEPLRNRAVAPNGDVITVEPIE
jgi:hypothetical protein